MQLVQKEDRNAPLFSLPAQRCLPGRQISDFRRCCSSKGRRKSQHRCRKDLSNHRHPLRCWPRRAAQLLQEPPPSAYPGPPGNALEGPPAAGVPAAAVATAAAAAAHPGTHGLRGSSRPGSARLPSRPGRAHAPGAGPWAPAPPAQLPSGPGASPPAEPWGPFTHPGRCLAPHRAGEPSPRRPGLHRASPAMARAPEGGGAGRRDLLDRPASARGGLRGAAASPVQGPGPGPQGAAAGAGRDSHGACHRTPARPGKRGWDGRRPGLPPRSRLLQMERARL